MPYRYNEKTKKVEWMDEEEEDSQDSSDSEDSFQYPEEDDSSNTASAEGLSYNSETGEFQQEEYTEEQRGGYFAKQRAGIVRDEAIYEAETRKEQEAKNEKTVQDEELAAAQEGFLSVDEWKNNKKQADSPYLVDKIGAAWANIRKKTTDVKGDETLELRKKTEGSSFQFNNTWAELQLKQIEDEYKNYGRLEYEYNTLSKESKTQFEEYRLRKLAALVKNEKEPIDSKPKDFDKFETIMADTNSIGDFAELYGGGLGPETLEKKARSEDLKVLADTYKQYLGLMDTKRDIVSGIARQFDTQDELLEKTPLVGGVPGIKKAVSLKATLEKYVNGEELDRNQLREVMQYQESIVKQRVDLGYGESVGSMLAYMPTFIIEFALTGGLASAGKSATTKVIGTAVEGSASTVVKGIARTAVGEAVRTGVGFLPRIGEKTANYMLPSYDIVANDKGEAKLTLLKQGDEFSDAFLKAGLGQYVENLSESAGILVDKPLELLKKAVLSKWLSKTAIKTGVELTEQASESLVQKALKAGGWNGIIGEVFEEEIAEPVQAKIEGREYFNPITTKEGRERLLVETLGITVFQGIASVSDLTLNTAKKIRSNEDAKGVRNILDINTSKSEAETKVDTREKIGIDPMAGKETFADVTQKPDFNIKEFLSTFEPTTGKAEGLATQSQNKYNAALEFITQNVESSQQSTKLNELRAELNIDDPIAQSVVRLIDNIFLPKQAKIDAISESTTSPAVPVTVEGVAAASELPPELSGFISSARKKGANAEQLTTALSKLETSTDQKYIEKGKVIRQQMESAGMSVEQMAEVVASPELTQDASGPAVTEKSTAREMAGPELSNLIETATSREDFVQKLKALPRASFGSDDRTPEAKQATAIQIQFVEYASLPSLESVYEQGGNDSDVAGMMYDEYTASNPTQTEDNLTINNTKDESNKENAIKQNSEQNKKEEAKTSSKTVWETAIAGKEDTELNFSGSEKKIIEYIEEIRDTKVTENALAKVDELNNSIGEFTDASNEDLQNLVAEETLLESLEEEIDAHKAKDMYKFYDKATGTVPEVTGQGRLFSKSGDTFASERGYEDSEALREGIKEYAELVKQRRELKESIKTARKGLKSIVEWFPLHSKVEISNFLKKVMNTPGKFAKTNPFKKFSKNYEAYKALFKVSDADVDFDSVTKELADLYIATPEEIGVIEEKANSYKVQKEYLSKAPSNAMPNTQNEGGKIRLSKYAERVKSEFEEYSLSNPLYETTNQSEDIKRATYLMEENYDLAMSIALGDVSQLPEGVTQTGVALAVRVKAFADGDNTLYALITNTLSRMATRRGAENAMLRGTHNSDSLEAMINDVVNNKMQMQFKKNIVSKIAEAKEKVQGKKVITVQEAFEKQKKKEVKELKQKLEGKNLKISSAQQIIDMLTCK